MEVDQICNVLLMGVAVVCVVLAWRVDINRSSENSRERFKRELNKK
jgi:sensor domain CHASE-containing protein